MMIGKQGYGDGSNEHSGLFKESRDSSPVSLASIIDQNNLWKYKPQNLQQEHIGKTGIGSDRNLWKQASEEKAKIRKDKNTKQRPLDRLVDGESEGDEYDSERDSNDSNLSAH